MGKQAKGEKGEKNKKAKKARKAETPLAEASTKARARKSETRTKAGKRPVEANEILAEPEAGELTVAEVAYHIWCEQGRPTGRALDHWLQAERRIDG